MEIFILEKIYEKKEIAQIDKEIYSQRKSKDSEKNKGSKITRGGDKKTLSKVFKI